MNGDDNDVMIMRRGNRDVGDPILCVCYSSSGSIVSKTLLSSM
jgi:hypothetical protein